MPVLGTGGRVLFKRPTPAPCRLRIEDFDAECNKFEWNCPGYWNGDQISVDKFPIFDSNGLPINPEGYASHQGSKYFVGPNRDHISNDTDNFYKSNTEEYPTGQTGNNAQFYVKEGVGDVPEGNGNGDYWLHIDQFGYVTFYKDRCAAISGCVDSAIDLAPIWLGDEPINIYPQGSADL